MKCRNKELDLNQGTLVMGILNITPDSFSDGGKFIDPQTAIDHALRMVEEGADMIDIGGESTRPGADPVSVDEELSRVIPVVEALIDKTPVPISIDTRKSDVAKVALETGVHLVNDISGFHFDPDMAETVANYRAPVILMHSKGLPKTMQENPSYTSLIQNISDSLLQSVKFAKKAGIPDDQIVLDPGIGFGKTVDDNFKIIAHLNEFVSLGFPILMGVSRKSFIGKSLNCNEENRIFGTAAAVSACIMNGAKIIRVHDVKAMHDVATIVDRIKSV